MTPLVPLMLIGWVPFTIFLCNKFKSHKAVIISVIGGVMFLPQTGYDIPGLPNYDKRTAIALGLLLGARLSGMRKATTFRWQLYDLPMIVFCCVPFISSLLNGLGSYEGLSGILEHVVFLGIFYLAGRMYFTSLGSLRDLVVGIVVGGLIYMPLCWYEIRMSPQLSNIFYGFFPNSFAQQYRYGGFRPVVFMSHGLMVALWMSICTVTAYWLWRSGRLKHIGGMPMSIIVVLLTGTTILCKSANGWLTMALGCGAYSFYKVFKTKMLVVLLLFLVAYPVCRVSGILSAETVTGWASEVVDQTREGSLGVRLLQEDLFVARIMERPFFGWGRMGRAWPRRADGRKAIDMIDSVWLIFFGVNGFAGLLAFYLTLFLGPWLTARSSAMDLSWQDERVLLPTVLSLGVLLFGLDTFVNGMPNFVFFVTAGALISFQGNRRKMKTPVAGPEKHYS